MESPGTHTFEMQDVPAIAAVARKYSIVTMIDNTYATPINFQLLKHGVDVVVHSATKYICGRSDVLMSTVTCNEKKLEAGERRLQDDRIIRLGAKCVSRPPWLTHSESPP